MLKKLLIGFGLLIALVVIGGGIIISRWNAAYESELDAWLEAGGAESMEELIGPMPPEKENAAVLYSAAIAAAEKVAPPEDRYAFSSNPFLEEEEAAIYSPGTAALPEIEALLHKYDEVITLLEQATAMEQCVWSMEIDLDVQAPKEILPDAGRLRHYALLLRTRAVYRIRTNDVESALQDFNRLARMTIHIGGGQALIQVLVAMAVESLVHESMQAQFDGVVLPRDEAIALSQTLAGIDGREFARRAILGEGVFALKELEEARSQGKMPQFPGRDLWLAHNEAEILRFYRQRLAQYEKPWREQEPVATVGGPAWSAALAGLLVGPIERFESVLQSNAARRTLARAAIALRLHKQAHGAYPESLAALDGAGDTDSDNGINAFIDPFTGKPIHYQLLEQGGFRVWVDAPPSITAKQGPIEWTWGD